MNERQFNKLLWNFRLDLKGLHHFKQDTLKTYLSCIRKYRLFVREKWNIDILQTKEVHLFEFILELKKNVSPSRITHFRAALRKFFRMLQLYGEIEHNPAKNLLPIKRKKSTRYHYIPSTLIFSVLKAIEKKQTGNINQRDKLMILLLWCLGLRSCELRSIRKEDIKIIDAQKKTGLLIVHGKGAKERALLIMDKLFDQLMPYINKFKDTDLIFPGKNHKGMNDSTINKRLQKYVNLAGITTHITAHCLRHSFATEMYYADVPLEAIRLMMGHESLRETALYIHVSLDDLNASLNLLSIGGKL
jgi:integrase/recombinase XerD